MPLPDRGSSASVRDFTVYNGGDLRGENPVADLMLETRIAVAPGRLDFALDLGGDQENGLVAQRSGDGGHLAEPHHDLDDLRDGDPERGREVLDADPRRNRDRPRRHGNSLLPRLDARGGTAVTCLPAVAAAGVAAVDHDSALAPGRASTRADGPVRLVGLVSHQESV